jgi:hypothetical protein
VEAGRGRGGAGVGEIERCVEGEGSRAGGPHPDQRGTARAVRQRPSRGTRVQCGVSAQWGGAESLMSGARLATGMGRRRGARGAWADPGRNEVGRAQMNNNVLDLFKSISN